MTKREWLDSLKPSDEVAIGHTLGAVIERRADCIVINCVNGSLVTIDASTGVAISDTNPLRPHAGSGDALACKMTAWKMMKGGAR